MANKGVTQDQVTRAADALVGAGERPTVERIRAFLGSGSPNTVTRLLEGWWQDLGRRLQAQQAKLALPEAPPAVAGLASQLWEQALASAQAHATDALDGERQDLAFERAALEDMRVALCDELEAATVARLDAERDCAVALTRVGDLQRLLEQQAAQVQELGTQRDQLRQELDAVQALVARAQGQLHERDALLAHERAEQTTHLRAVEDRAHAEVDWARQETKALQTQLAAQERERTTSEKQLRQRYDEAAALAAIAQRDAGAQRARAETLEQQLAKLVNLPAALEASLAEARAPRRSANRAPRSAGSKTKKSPRSRS